MLKINTKILISLIATTIALAISEIACRYIFQDKILLSEFRPNFGPRYAAAYSTYLPFTTPRDFRFEVDTEKGIFYDFNHFGFRGPDPVSTEKPKNSKRWLFLGDSFLLGWGVKEELTFASLTREKLREQIPGSEIINAGYTNGYSPDAYYAFLKKEGLLFNPDLIAVVIFTGNDVLDIADNIWVERDDSGAPTKVNTIRAYTDYLGNYLNINALPWYLKATIISESKLFVSTMNRIYTALYDFNLKSGKLGKSITLEEAFSRFRISLSAIKEIANSKNIPLKVILIPRIGDLEDRGKYGEKIVDILKGLSIEFLDLYQMIRPEHRISPVDAHLNIDGNHLVAQELIKFTEREMQQATPQ